LALIAITANAAKAHGYPRRLYVQHAHGDGKPVPQGVSECIDSDCMITLVDAANLLRGECDGRVHGFRHDRAANVALFSYRRRYCGFLFCGESARAFSGTAPVDTVTAAAA